MLNATPFQLREYGDAEVTFTLLCYRDPIWLELALTALRRAYPTSRVIAVSDGDPDPRLGQVAAYCGAEFTYEPERMFLKEYGGRIVHRMLASFLTAPTPWLIKIDTDTKVCRRLTRLPVGRCLFGCTQCNGDLTSIQGGFVGHTLEAVAELYTSGILADPGLADYERTWASSSASLREYIVETGRTSTDWILGYAAGGLGIAMIDYPEVLSLWQEPLPDDGRFAVIHPCREMHNCAKR